MIQAERFINSARQHGFALYTGVPCSHLTPFINFVIEAPELHYVGAANEGDAVAIAAGAELGGLRSIAMCQNSGLGNMVSPLTSLTWTFRIPVLLITTLRGDPAGDPDEPQHQLMGRITSDMLELMDVPWADFPAHDDQVDAVLEAAVASMTQTSRPYALIMRKGSVAKFDLNAVPPTRPLARPIRSAAQPSAQRAAMLQAVQAAAAPEDVIIATTGYTGRELYACQDRPNQLYMVGSMGCAVSLGVGLAVARPERRIIVLDGDGAALMRLGALATVGFERPANLVHVLLDNGLHESTGGQATVSRSLDFPGLAVACGYPRVVAASTPAALADELKAATGQLTFIHAPIRPGTTADLPRPVIKPHEVATRLRAHLGPPG